jgi:hypothetical protein
VKRRAAEDDRAESHGRVEIRRVVTTTRLTGYLDWPGAKQVCLLERVRRSKGKETAETVCAITSLDPERDSADRLLAPARGHWGIEIPRPEDPRSDNLCAVGRAGYHRRGRPVGVDRVERQQLSGPRSYAMLNSKSACVPPRPRFLRRAR